MNKQEIITLLKNTLIMLLITLVAGGILGVVYEVTKTPIAEMELKVKQQANQKVFTNADEFTALDIEDYKSTLSYSGVDISEVLEAHSASGDMLGYVMEVTSHEGYGGDIIFRIGISENGSTNGISITSISETAGLGMRAEEVIVPQFKGRTSEVFEVVKTGSVMDNQIDAISSATITSKAITKGVNAALEYFRLYLVGGAN